MGHQQKTLGANPNKAANSRVMALPLSHIPSPCPETESLLCKRGTGGQPEVPHGAGCRPRASHSAARISAPAWRSNPAAGQGEACVGVGTQPWPRNT